MFLNSFKKHHATNFTFACQAMFLDVAKQSNICRKANLDVEPAMFDRLAWAFHEYESKFGIVLIGIVCLTSA